MVSMKTSIILLRYDFTNELYRLTQSATESLETLGADELILIDNSSTVGEVRDWADVYVKNKVNRGYCQGVNQGFKLAKGDLIAVANNDIRVSLNALEVAKGIFMENLKVGSVHFRMVPYDEPMWLGMDTWIGGKERWCHSSFYVIRRETLPEGLYWEGYKEGGYDDYDFWHRVRDINGWKQAYTNKAAFQHKDSSTYMALDRRDGTRSERDLKNRESYRTRFGEYPDVQFANLFPEQMKEAWKPFP